jgi:hypothetical protein
MMQCLACRADNKMLLMDVLRDDTIKVPVIERQTYMCSACRHIARRLVFSRAKMPVAHLPVITTPRSRQIDLKERASAAKTAAWTKAVEKLRSKQAALAQRAAVASRQKLAEDVPVPATPPA